MKSSVSSRISFISSPRRHLSALSLLTLAFMLPFSIPLRVIGADPAGAIASSPEASQIAALRRAYEESARRGAAPVVTRYIGELESLKSTYARASKLPAAAVVERELNQLKRSLGQAGDAIQAPAEGAAEVDPPELLQIRNAYRDDLWRAGRPAHLRYQEDLKALKNRYTQAANAAAAAVVEQELQTTTQSDGLDFMVNDKILDGTVWNWPWAFEPGNRFVRFNPDGTSTAMWGHLTRPYKWTSANTISIHPWADFKLTTVIQFNFPFTQATVISTDNNKRLIGTKLTLHTAPAISGAKPTTTVATAPPATTTPPTATTTTAPALNPQEPFNGLSWPRTMTGDRVEFHADHTFLEVWGSQDSPGRWHMVNKTDAQVIYKGTGKGNPRIKHFRISSDGSVERLEDHVHWPK